MNIIIDKLVFGGQALGNMSDGRKVFVWNALPGEEVEINVLKKKKNMMEAIATKIIKPSPNRIPATEAHFLSCSPWQILSAEAENIEKINVAKEVFQKIGGFELPADIEIAGDNNLYQYRNKIEYSFWEEDGKVFPAFYDRGAHYRHPIDLCNLASKEINTTAQLILDWINQSDWPLRAFKTMIVRSNLKGETVAAIFIKDRVNLTSPLQLQDKFIGLQVYYSDPRCPASRPDELLYSKGQDYLIENIKGVDLKYGLLSFFQVNIPIFTQALDDIEKQIPANLNLIDLYSGVGSISLPLKRPTTLVEINDEAVDYANDNIELNSLTDCQAILKPAENATEVITNDKLLIVDPPRAGMHDDVVDKILEAQPPQIIYLSCDLATQARDIAKLLPTYKVKFAKLYNFFPRTPHIESLIILTK
jgi:23S rRNA (uracil1939-C5)-methyltransferase